MMLLLTFYIFLFVCVVVFYLFLLRRRHKKMERQLGALQTKHEDYVRETMEEHLSEKNKLIQKLSWDDNVKLTEEDWKIIEKTVLSTSYQFKEILQTHKLSWIEYQVCLLIKLDVKPSRIALLVNRSKENITSIRRRLSQKVLHCEKGNPTLWDEYIQTL